MQCLCEANENLELALEALYERFGRQQFFEDGESLPKIKEIIEAAQYAQFELEEHLDSLDSDEEDLEEPLDSLASDEEEEEPEGEPEKGVTSFGHLA